MTPPASGSHSRLSRARLLLEVAAATLLGLGLLFHFVVVFFYLTPMNPIKAQWRPQIHAYVEPLFAQNWHLFAPTPVTSNYAVMVNCRSGDPARETGWKDATHAIVARLHRNRISPMSRLARMHLGAVRGYLFGDNSLDEVLARQLCTRQPEHPVCKRSDRRSEIMEREARHLLQRLATNACADIDGTAAGPDEVNIRIAEHRPPPFSARHLPDEQGTVGYIDLGWQPAATATHPVNGSGDGK